MPLSDTVQKKTNTVNSMNISRTMYSYSEEWLPNIFPFVFTLFVPLKREYK